MITYIIIGILIGLFCGLGGDGAGFLVTLFIGISFCFGSIFGMMAIGETIIGFGLGTLFSREYF